MDFSKINQELLKINHNTYQNIRVDKEKNRIEISEPWNGKILYLIGYKTDMKDLSDYLMNTMKATPNEIQKNTYSDDKKQVEVLVTIKIFSKIIKENNEINVNLNELKKIKSEIKQAIIKKISLLNPEEFKTKVFANAELANATTHPFLKLLPQPNNYAGFETFSEEDQALQKIYINQYEHYKKVKEAYKQIEQETNSLQPKDSNAEIFNYHAIDFDTDSNTPFIYEGTFKAYRLEKDQKFLIHSTDFSNAIPLIRILQAHDFPSQTMCTSLIDSQSSFFHADRANRIALILAVDANQIVMTSLTDISTPTDPKVASKFYNQYKKLQLLTERIHHIHQSSGQISIAQKYKTLTKLKNEAFWRRDALREAQKKISSFGASTDEEWEFADEADKMFVKEIIKSNRLIDSYFKEREKVVKDYEELDIRQFGDYDPLDCMFKWEPMIELAQLIKYYEENPEKNQSTEEFMKIFNHTSSGIGIVEELKKYKKLVQNLRLQSLLLSPDVLLTHGDTFQHNEVNLKLDTFGTRGPEVRGVLVTRHMLETYANTSKSLATANDDLAYLGRIIQFAKTNNLPIFILEAESKQRVPTRSKL